MHSYFYFANTVPQNRPIFFAKQKNYGQECLGILGSICRIVTNSISIPVRKLFSQSEPSRTPLFFTVSFLYILIKQKQRGKPRFF